MSQAELFTISDLAREFDVTLRTIRFYEEQGLIEPQRDGRQRLFTRRDRGRLKLILRGKRIGLSLAEIREIIDMYQLAETRPASRRSCWTCCWRGAASWKRSGATSTRCWMRSLRWKIIAAT
ncbi:Zn(II)-responsive regulator of zntA [Chromobacterium violaceum]|uniref:Zn(II)-responsive regulator of zntA n=1 Tax=Chromobacterium violaceum TaxID=536 RepID=A0A3S4LJ67_CHRVL|nr:Zn(II)-responsive regulator of zntA [Chromobacterium violaceum]